MTGFYCLKHITNNMNKSPFYTFNRLVKIQSGYVAEFKNEFGETHRVNEENLITIIPNWEKSCQTTADEHKAALAAIRETKVT